MEIETLTLGQLQTNCYLVWDGETKETLIIDPADDGDFIIRKIQDKNLTPKYLLATHGHFDHVLAALELKLAFSLPFLGSQKDQFLLTKARTSALHFTGLRADPVPPFDRFLKEDETIQFGKESLKVVETPGHTPGSLCFYAPGILFSGDTFFADGLGRTDFVYASAAQLTKSLQNRILTLPDQTQVYPGHGLETSISDFKKFMLK